MANSSSDVCNLALSRIGITRTISSLIEKSAEAKAFSRIYAQMRQEVLSEYPWPFATGYVDLALIETDPNTDWAYSYRYPQNCIRIRKILDPAGRVAYSNLSSGNTFEQVGNPMRIPYTLSSDSGGKIILTDQQNASVEITKDVMSEVIFTAKFVSAFAWKLAAEGGPGIASGDPYKLVAKAEAKYMRAIMNAGNDAFNEVEPDQLPDSEFIRSRQ